MTEGATYRLPAKLDLAAATPLVSALRDLEGQPLVLDAHDVTHIGTPGVQVLLSARRTWTESGHALRLENVSDALGGQLEPLGLTKADLETVSSDDGAPLPLPPALQSHDPEEE